ncbi:hypothetical protein JIQ42_06412 [Leishmania sp. Namibia]|uniref:hypothetical protein n=1 Tax=Leishmania sp. Namibia TaxID=2802991 RepID=UPI001B535C45|nr:hypothetical protein JIQ42_06412 [Leishmania sp. Namibia]
MASFISALLPVPMRLVLVLLGTLALLAASARTSAANVSHRFAARTSPECVAYADHFPHVQTATDCPLKGLCLLRKRCCRRMAETDPRKCLDITAFSCDTASVCANRSSTASDRSTSTSTWRPETQDGGASLVCCQATTSTTEAPAVPPLHGRDLKEVFDNTDSLPGTTCDDATSTACTVVTMFAPITRAFCQNPILDMYNDAYLNENAPRMCCQYAAGPLDSSGAAHPNAGKAACGSNLLDLPRTGEYHCSLAVRGTSAVCCNGRIESSPSSSADNGSAAPSDQRRAFTYINSECLFIHESPGNSASPLAMLMARLLTVAILSVMAAHLCE